jgi:MFS family permease
LLWLGLSAGCFVLPKWSDVIKRRKLPILVGLAVQLIAVAMLIYCPVLSPGLALLLCFLFGFANAEHMLTFSSAADVVKPEQIGTSASLVNGAMFIVGGIMISRPGARIGLGLEEGLEAKSLELAQYAARPLMIAILLTLPIALFMRETYPRQQTA